MRQFFTALLCLLAIAAFAGGGAEVPRGASQDSSGGETGSSSGAPDSSAPVPSAGDRELIEGGISPVRGFSTDFSRSIVPEGEILSGGPPKDGIPAIDDPSFVPVDSVDWIGASEPVLIVTADGETRLYPLQILTYHEIVNDTVGETPLAVTFCPLCNTGIVFRRSFDGQVLDFGTTGRLRYSNLLMYDRQTETWWQQATGEGVVGRHATRRLEFYPVMMLPWDAASSRYADAEVLSRDTGHSRSYGTNPYTGYDTATRPFLYQGPEVGSQYSPMARVIQVVVDGESFAVAYPVLAEERVVEERVAGAPIVVLWSKGTSSALDSRSIREGRDVGSANAFRAEIDGQELSFRATGDGFADEQTGSTWDASGRATGGALAGSELEPLVGIQHFWFSYSAFEPVAGRESDSR